MRAGESSAVTDDALRAVSMNQTVRTSAVNQVAIVPVRLGTEVVGSLGLSGEALSETVLKSIGSLLSVVLERVQAGEKLIVVNRELEQRHQQVEQ